MPNRSQSTPDTMSTKRSTTNELRQIGQNRRPASDLVHDIAKASKMEPPVREDTSRVRHSRSRSPSCDARRDGSHRPHSGGSSNTDSPLSTLTPLVLRVDRLRSHAEKSGIHIFQELFPLKRWSLFITPLVDRVVKSKRNCTRRHSEGVVAVYHSTRRRPDFPVILSDQLLPTS